jgi:hypothetical protein
MSIALNANNDGTGSVQIGGSDAIQLSTGLNATFPQNLNAPNTFGFKNRIINGDMRIDQRNAGASVTPTADATYTIDRWSSRLGAASKFSIQRNAASVTPPVGFTNYLGITSLSAYSIGSSDYFAEEHRIEGFNIADLAWGTASAAPVTISFWIRSSLTGTFGGAITNNAQNRSYPFTYTINSANTWEKETITIAGDTSGTWLTDNNVGAAIRFGFGAGSTFSGTAGAWSAGNFFSATGATSVVGTNGATFYVTGVQLEKGSTATSFDYRSYGTELALCQRYYWKATLPGATFTTNLSTHATTRMPVTMRAIPTLDSGATFTAATGNNGTVALNSGTGYTASGDGVGIYNSANNWTVGATVTLVGAGFNAEL